MIFTDWYAPGYRAGGPIQSVYNLAKLLSKNFNVKVVTRNTDYSSAEIYAEIIPDLWTKHSPNHEVIYLSASNLKFKTIKNLCKTHQADIMLINGLFSFYFSILPLFFANYLGNTRTFVAVRGMLHQSALNVKPLKKQLFLAFARGFGLYRTTTLLSTSSFEKDEITKTLGRVKVVSAPNIPIIPNENFDFDIKKFKSESGQLRLLFLGRISPEKNPVMVLKALKDINLNIKISFAGAGLDSAYQNIFDTAMRDLPNNIEVNCLNELPHQEILNLFKQIDVMILPSHGENFGHAIFESLANATPVIISNNTPWKNMMLEKAGLEVNSNSLDEISNAIQYFNNLSQLEYREWQIGSLNMALSYMDKNDFEKIYSTIFNV